jgi:hypothetical protein
MSGLICDLPQRRNEAPSPSTGIAEENALSSTAKARRGDTEYRHSASRWQIHESEHGLKAAMGRALLFNG